MTQVVEEPGSVVVVQEPTAPDVIEVQSPGPKGDKGVPGDVNPQMTVLLEQAEAARDAAQQAASDAAAAVGPLEETLGNHIGSGGAAHANAVAAGAAGFMSGADKTKLDGVATGATANATDAALRARSSHTGQQLASTISDFSSAALATVLTGLSLLTGTPIAAADTVLVALGKLQKQVTDTQSSITAAAPAGMVAFYAVASAPTGWLKANGGAVSRTTYAALFTAIGTTYGAGDGTTTFNLPDARGEFFRALDDGRGVDISRVLGSAQADAMQGHQHTVTEAGPTPTTALAGANYIGYSGYGPRNASNPVTDGANGTPRIASETRARNIAWLACIKY